MASEAGITFIGQWTFDRGMKAVGAGIALFGRKLEGGLAQLKSLLGGWAAIIHGSCFGVSCALPPGTHTVRLSNSLLKGPSEWIAQTTVHELAHVIDWHSFIQVPAGYYGWGHFSDAWSGAPLTGYAAGDEWRPYPRRWERWAEAVTVWVFGAAYKGKETEKMITPTALTAQMDRITALLNGWY